MLSEGNKIELDDLCLLGSSERQTRQAPRAGCEEPVDVHDIVPLRVAAESTERQLLQLAFKELGKTSRVSKALGVDASTITRKLNRYGLLGKIDPINPLPALPAGPDCAMPPENAAPQSTG